MWDIHSTIENWLTQGRSIALATVVQTWGSSPRQAGAKMGITADLSIIGSVSGGCVEAAVIDAALESLNDQRPRLLHFGVSDDTAWDVGLACGGKISVYVEPLDINWWQAASDAMRQNRTFVTISIIDGPDAGQKVVISAGTGEVYASAGLSQEQHTTLAQAGQTAIDRGSTKRTQLANADVLIDVLHPSPKLIIVGGAHVAMALHYFARQLGFRVVLVDPRRAFATRERFPEAELILHSYPDKAFAEIGLDSQTYIAILTHDPKIDDPALHTALPANVPYVGLLSSQRSHQQRTERLIAGGINPQLLAQIHVPIGLDIGAKTPEEIALCIMAQIVATRNRIAS
jgi:xanthine dehydrogenase accessory factor